MEPDAAREAMARILKEERQRPTIRYKDNLSDIKQSTNGNPIANMAAVFERLSRPNIAQEQAMKVRPVWEKPEVYSLGGTNYDLLVLLFTRLGADARETCIDAMLRYLGGGGETSRSTGVVHYPTFDWQVSDTPLIAEFLVRLGEAERLFRASAEAQIPTHGTALMLMQVEEMIALNFNVFSESELKRLPKWLAPLRETADLQTHESRGSKDPRYKPGREKEARAIVDAIDGISAECDQAIFFYIKGALQQTRNPEVEGDKIKLIGFLEALGFTPNLRNALEEAEKEYRDDASSFELKSCLGHLRSFLEFVHRESAKSVAAAAGETVTDKWGDAILYLRQKDFLTKQHEAFAASLYTLISDTSVHPLGTDREYARLLRNVVIEYGVMFLSVLDGKGVKIT